MTNKSPLEKKKFDLKKRSASAIMKHRINNPITFVKESPKMREEVKNLLPPSDKECYLNLNTFGMMPVDMDYFKKLAIEWIAQARNTEMLLMTEYPAQKGIPAQTFLDWINRCPELKEAQSLVRTIIAMRRERGGLKNEYNGKMVERMQHLYDRDWRDAEEWRANLAVKSQINTQQPVTVILEAFPSSNLVPPKKED
jgi:hypothetical protein